MTDDLQREKQLFLQALDLPGDEERRAFVEQACAGDPALCARLDQLLGNATKADTFFATPPDLASLTPQDDAPSVVDRYRLVRRIGQGSCGVVYLAEQQEPVRREVALKIIRLGMDTGNVIARFSLERQALALMDHPNIARVYDAGATPTGRPYFVMEHVHGLPLTDYCDRHALDVPARLDLFVKVCNAVAHAHQRGIVHRDIKPANILVIDEDRTPTPKLIDFGVAKAIDQGLADRPDSTLATQLIGTPSYMSPEQVLGDGSQIDTRSDLYSLGALLYELLVGQPPFQSAQLTRQGLPGLIRTLREVDPPRPSALFASLSPEERETRARLRATQPARLLRALRQDLDWIVVKAIEKQPARRYETAHALATEILHLRQNEPVSARPPSRAYRFGKLVRRNRVVFLAGTLAVFALLLGTTTTTWLFIRERDALRTQVLLREQAENARANEALLRSRAEAVNTFSAAAVHLSHGDLAKADLLVGSVSADLVPPSLENARVLRQLGQKHALAGDWQTAADRFLALAHVITRTDDADSDSVSHDLVAISAALCQADRPDHYDTFRQLALARFAATSHPVVAEQVVKCCLIRPAPPDVMETLRASAAVAEDSLHPHGASTDPEAYLAAWRCIALSLYNYRSGRHDAARHWAERSLRYPQGNDSLTATAFSLLAMIHQARHDPESARAALRKARGLIPSAWSYPLPVGNQRSGSWSGWVHARLFFDEAAATTGL